MRERWEKGRLRCPVFLGIIVVRVLVGVETLRQAQMLHQVVEERLARHLGESDPPDVLEQLFPAFPGNKLCVLLNGIELRDEFVVRFRVRVLVVEALPAIAAETGILFPKVGVLPPEVLDLLSNSALVTRRFFPPALRGRPRKSRSAFVRVMTMLR